MNQFSIHKSTFFLVSITFSLERKSFLLLQTESNKSNRKIRLYRKIITTCSTRNLAVVDEQNFSPLGEISQYIMTKSS